MTTHVMVGRPGGLQPSDGRLCEASIVTARSCVTLSAADERYGCCGGAAAAIGSCHAVGWTC